MIENETTTHVFFHRDMDGLCCAFLLYAEHFASNQNVKYRPVQYKETINFSNVQQGDAVFFVDFTPSLEEAKRLFELKPKCIRILDHHPVEELHDQIDLAARGRGIDFTCGLSTRAKGAVAFVGEWLGLPVLDPLTKHVGLRDVWDFADPDTKAINEGIGALAPFPNCDDEAALGAWFRRYQELRHNSYRVLEIGRLLLNKMEADVQKAAKRATVWEIRMDTGGGFIRSGRLLGVFADTNISELGNYLAEQYEFKFAFVATIDKGELRLSFRSVEGCSHDARNWALSYGGGGHPHAAGASFKKFRIDTSKDVPCIEVVENI